MVQLEPTATSIDDFSDEFDMARGSRIRTILVCLDRSVLSEASLPFARFVAEAFDAETALVHVIPIAPDASEPGCVDPIEWRVSLREAEAYLQETRHEFEERGAGASRVSVELTQGRPAERIVSLARERGADLIVLATHGEGGLGPTNLGSTAQQVVALAPCSVLIVPSDTAARVTIPPKRILVPLDGSLRTESVLPVVTSLAQRTGALVSLVHVVAEPTPSAVLVDGDDLALARDLASRIVSKAERYLGRIRKHLLRSVRDVEVHVLREIDQRRALLDLGDRLEVDLVVLTAHGNTCDMDRAVGTVASYALAHSRAPVLVLQDLPSDRSVKIDDGKPRESNPPPRDLQSASARSY